MEKKMPQKTKLQRFIAANPEVNRLRGNERLGRIDRFLVDSQKAVDGVPYVPARFFTGKALADWERGFNAAS